MSMISSTAQLRDVLYAFSLAKTRSRRTAARRVRETLSPVRCGDN